MSTGSLRSSGLADDPLLPTTADLLVIHDVHIARFGGSSGIRDVGLLESAIGRAQMAATYADLETVGVAAVLCHGILKNHAFVDGNKRTAYGALVMTLAAGGWRLEAQDMEIAERILEAAASQEGPESLQQWVRDRVRPDDTYRLLREKDEVPEPDTAELEP